MGGEDAISKIQIMCAGCHQEKTTHERLNFVDEGNPLLSRFSVETHEAFVKSQKPLQLVATLNEAEDSVI